MAGSGCQNGAGSSAIPINCPALSINCARTAPARQPASTAWPQSAHFEAASNSASSGNSMAKAKPSNKRAADAGDPHDHRRGDHRGAARARHRHDLCAARGAQRPPVRRAVQGRQRHHAPSTPATSRAPPIWRSARRWRPAKPQVYTVVPGPGLLNSSGRAAHRLRHERAGARAHRSDPAGGDRPRAWPPARDPRPGRHHLAAGRFFRPHPRAGRSAAPLVDTAIRAMRSGRPGPAVLECAIDVWGRSGPVAPIAPPAPPPEPPIDDDAIRDAAKRLGAAKRPLIVCGGGAQDASPEVTALSQMLQAPVLAFRRGRGVLDGRDPFSVTLPLGRDLWARSRRRCSASAHGCSPSSPNGASDKELAIVRIDADPRGSRSASSKPAVALVGDAAPILRRLLDELARTQSQARLAQGRNAGAPGASWPRRLAKLAPQTRLSSKPSAPNCRTTASSSTRSPRWALPRGSRLPVYKPRTFLSPGYQDNLGWGFATALGRAACPARRAGAVNLGRRRLPLHRQRNGHCDAPPHSAGHVVVSPTAPSAMSAASRRNITATADRQRSRQSGFRQICRELRRRGRAGARLRRNCAPRCGAAFTRRDGPTLIEVPVGPMPSPWEFIHMPPIRGSV